MSEALYLEDHYLKEWEATVVSANGKFVVLDKTAFYPKSGGQPWDEGTINDFKVVYVGKFSGEISHQVDRGGLKTGEIGPSWTTPISILPSFNPSSTVIAFPSWLAG